MRSNKIKGSLIAGVVATLCATTVAGAGTGVGAVFNLGQTNSVDGATSLTGTTDGTQLNVWNLSTAAAARAFVAYVKSVSAVAAAIQNAGGGPALALVVNAGQPPLTVNSSGKVASLNADQVDGLDASSFEPRYGRTVVVRSVGTDAQNGTALRNALAGITTASPSSPWLLKVEPGIYDVGTPRFVMKADVDVEGSGEGVTTIRGGGGGCVGNESATVLSTVDATLRSLTVVNTGGCDYATAIWSDGPLDLRDVKARASGGAISSRGIILTGGFKQLTDVTADAQGNGGSTSARGIEIVETVPPASPRAQLVRVDARAHGASPGSNVALLDHASNVVVRRSRLRTDAVSDPTLRVESGGRVLALWTLLDTGPKSVEPGATYKCGANYDANGVYLC
jgi:hypothetical protein